MLALFNIHISLSEIAPLQRAGESGDYGLDYGQVCYRDRDERPQVAMHLEKSKLATSENVDRGQFSEIFSRLLG